LKPPRTFPPIVTEETIGDQPGKPTRVFFNQFLGEQNGRSNS
jgi:hypothetical protein